MAGTKRRSLAQVSANVPSPKRLCSASRTSCPPKPPTKSATKVIKKSRCGEVSPSGTPKSSVHSCPNEVLLNILKQAELCFTDPIDQQRQRLTHNRVCKAWSRLDLRADTYAVRGFRQIRRLARTMSFDFAKANHIQRIDIEILFEDRLGTKQMVHDLLVRCSGIKQLSLVNLGRERYIPDAACLTVPLYDAFAMQDQLEEFRIFFHRHWTALTLGGDLTRTLTKLGKLKRLDLPRVYVPRGATTFPFTPALTHLSMHLGDAGAIELLNHLISTSLDTLSHLQLTLQEFSLPNVATSSTFPLVASLAPVVSQLRSFSLTMPYSRSRIPAPSIHITALLTSLTRLDDHLTLCAKLTPDLSAVLACARRVRRLTYHVASEWDVKQLVATFADAPLVEATLLVECNLVCWGDLSYIASRVSIEKGGLKACSERRGITFSSIQGVEPSEEDDRDDSSA